MRIGVPFVPSAPFCFDHGLPGRNEDYQEERQEKGASEDSIRVSGGLGVLVSALQVQKGSVS